MTNENRNLSNEDLQIRDILSQLESLNHQLSRLATDVRPSVSADTNLAPSEENLDLVARRQIVLRNIRAQFFVDEQIGEAGWNILLDLFVQERAKKLVSIKSACLASQAPETTGLRYVKYLESIGLIAREDDPEDLRRSYLYLTEECRETLRQYLTDVAALYSGNDV